MNSQYRRLFGSKAGFSFIELLITMIIAGIAFAALVPVFVQAAKSGSNDKSRAVALNIAQDAIENTRRITFEQVTTSSWVQNEVTASGTKPFNVQRTVEDQTASPSDTRIISKAVSVTVSWDAPLPGGSVLLKTVLYRQFAGPQIVDFTVAPWDADNEWITDASVDLTAIVNSADIPSMAPVTIGGTTLVGRVDFMITSIGGTVIPTISVPYDGTHPGTYTATWATPGGYGLNDGYWAFKAVAFSSQKYPGNTWQFVKRIESGPPAAVSGLVGTAGYDSAYLTWGPSSSSDLAYYRVVRTNQDGSTTIVTGDPDDTATQLKDTGIMEGPEDGLVSGAVYTYTVYAVDQVGNMSIGVSVDVGTGGQTTDQPEPATNLVVEAFGSTAKLTWTASMSSDVTGYLVYTNGQTKAVATVATPYCIIEQGWNTTVSYQVKPFRAGSNPGMTSFASTPMTLVEVISGVAWPQLAIGDEPLFTLAVMNNVQTGKTATITLKYLGPEGRDPGITVSPVALDVAYSSTSFGASWQELKGGYYQFSWVTSNNKTGSRVVQLTLPQSAYQEKCIP
jgi:prepilin-type N-terminal cleavage/methylation domain-containing protein